MIINLSIWIVSLMVKMSMIGFVYSYLWLWYISPLGLPEISLFHGAGISLFLMTLIYTDTDILENNKSLGGSTSKDELYECGKLGLSLSIIFAIGWTMKDLI